MPRRREFGIADQLLGLVIVILVSYFMLKRWSRNRALKQEEIRKLLVLAAEEDARVEAELLADYSCSYTSYSTIRPTPVKVQVQEQPPQEEYHSQYQPQKEQQQQQFHECAVCFSPTTTRCSRCKAVRYCSGKCQIVHWRQGHKFECKPPEDDNFDASRPTPISSHKSEVKLGEPPVESLKARLHDSDGESSKTVPLKKVNGGANGMDASSTAKKKNGSIHRSLNGFQPTASPVPVSKADSKTSEKNPKLDPAAMKDLDTNVKQSTDSFANVSAQHSPIHSKSERSLFSSSPVSSEDKSTTNGIHTPDSSSHAAASLKKKTTRISGNSNIYSSSVDSSNGASSVMSSRESSHSGRYVNVSDHPTNHVSDHHESAEKPEFLKKSNGSTYKNCGTASQNGNGYFKHPHRKVPRDYDMGSSNGRQEENGYRYAAQGSNINNIDNISETRTHNFEGLQSQVPDSTAYTDQPSKVSRGPLSTKDDSSINTKTDDSAILSDSNGGRSKSFRTFSQHTSSQKEKTSRSRRSGSFDASTFQNVVKRVAQQLKPFIVTKQISSRLTNEGSSKAKLTNEGSSKAKLTNESSSKANKILFPYEAFVKLFNCDKFDLPPRGLINCGNSCYANAVLQCLMVTRPIATYLVQGLHSRSCQKREWCFTCELQSLNARMRESKVPVSPVRILSKIQNIGHHLGVGREEDAHEFLRFAIDTMQSICLFESGERSVDLIGHETTIIQQTFGGYLMSRIKCLKCNHVSERYEKMLDLTVEIEGNIGSLQDALGRFTAPEILEGPNKYKCGRCKTYAKAKKQLTIYEAPNILTIALKRFQSGKFGKLNKRVSYPEILNLKPYMSGSGDKPPSYKLYAVVVHLDTMNDSYSGHYVCYVKHFQGYWYKMDDSKVKQVDIDRVLSQGAYMLLYARSSPRAPVIPKSWVVDSATTVNVVTSSKAVKQPILSREQGRYGTPSGRYSAVSPYTFNTENYGIPYLGSRAGTRDYTDLTSSDSGSLFSFSDEASCSTESNRDSTSTDDFAETVFGDPGHMAHSSSGIYEDSCRVSRSQCRLKSTPSPRTEYYFDNGTVLLDKNLNEDQRFERYPDQKNIDQESCSPTTNPHDTNGSSPWLSNDPSSFFFPTMVSSNHAQTYSLHSDPRSRHIDSRNRDCSSSVESSHFRNSVVEPGLLSAGSDSSSTGFVDPTRSRYTSGSYRGFFAESDRLNFGLTPTSANLGNSDYYFVQNGRTFDSPSQMYEPDR